MRGALILLAIALPGAARAQMINPAAPASDVRSADITLDASGNGVWNFTLDANGQTLPPFAGVPDVTHMPKAMNASDFIVCNFQSLTRTSVSVHCGRTALTGLLMGLFSGSIAGAQVHLIARYRPS